MATRSSKKITLTFGRLLVYIVIFVVISDIAKCAFAPSVINPLIRSAVYVAPEGCEVKHYLRDSDISKNCVSDKYKISYYGKYHFPYTKFSNGYFRVGDDAINIRCTSGEQYCFAINIVYGVYVR